MPINPQCVMTQAEDEAAQSTQYIPGCAASATPPGDASIGPLQRSGFPDAMDEQAGLSPLESTVQSAFMSLAPATALSLKRGAAKAADAWQHVGESGRSEWRIGTLYAGCDIVMHVVGSICAMAESMWGLAIEPRCVFQVEKDESKREHLLSQTAADHLFDSCEDVADGKRAWCYRQLDHIRAPWAHTMIAGFPCTSRSKLNRGRAETVGCCQASEGATGEGYRTVSKCIRQHRPKVVILENVLGLSQASNSGDKSDSSFIEDDLASMGYWGEWVIVQATEYGSPVERERMFFLGVHEAHDPDGSAGSLLREVMRGLKSDPLDARACLVAPSWARGVQLPAKRAASAKAGYRDEHFELFRLANLPWPIEPSSVDPFVYNIRLQEVGERAFDEIYFLNEVFPPAAKIEFCDVNTGLSWQLGGIKLGLTRDEFLQACKKSPWRPVCGTLVSGSIIVMRETSDIGISSVRVLHGLEHMALIGWDFRLWRRASIPGHDTMVSMAGNAFSGWACIPILVSALCMPGILGPGAKADAPLSVCDSDSAEEDSS